MPKYLVLAAMKGEFLARSGNVYENFQMLGYVESAEPFGAIKTFFEDPHFPIDWRDVTYMWAESLDDDVNNGHYGEYDRIYVENLMRSPFDDSSTVDYTEALTVDHIQAVIQSVDNLDPARPR